MPVPGSPPAVREEKAPAPLCVLSNLVQLEDVAPEGRESWDTRDCLLRASHHRRVCEGPCRSCSKLRGALADLLLHSTKYRETAKHPFEREPILLRRKKWIIFTPPAMVAANALTGSSRVLIRRCKTPPCVGHSPRPPSTVLPGTAGLWALPSPAPRYRLSDFLLEESAC